MSRLCQDRSVCDRDATWGVYLFKPGQTTVDTRTQKPVKIFCGKHKSRIPKNALARNIPL